MHQLDGIYRNLVHKIEKNEICIHGTTCFNVVFITNKLQALRCCRPFLIQSREDLLISIKKKNEATLVTGSTIQADFIDAVSDSFVHSYSTNISKRFT